MPALLNIVGTSGMANTWNPRPLKCSIILAIAVVLPAQGPPVNTILVILLVILSVILANGYYLKKFSQKKAKDTHNLPPPQPFHPKRCENLCKPNENDLAQFIEAP
jgi:hypothetical protein